MNILVILSRLIFRISPTDLRVVPCVLNNTADSSEETKVVRDVTEVYVHGEFKEVNLINDNAILKVRILSKYENKYFEFFWIGTT